MALEALPNEILVHLMGDLQQPSDLKALTHASAQCYRIYRHSKGPILSSIVRTCVEPTVLPLALKACDTLVLAEFARDLDPAWAPQLERLGTMVDHFVEDQSVNAGREPLYPSDLAVLQRLFKLCDAVEFLAHEFFVDAIKQAHHVRLLRDRPFTFGDAQEYRRTMSRQERSRLQKAFFRLESSRNLRSALTRLRDHGVIDEDRKREILDWADSMSAWEREEFISVYFFLTGKAREVFSQVEDDLLARLKTVKPREASARAVWNLALRNGIALRSSATAELMPFSLATFTEAARGGQRERTEATVGRGLSSFKAFLQQDDDARILTVAKSAPMNRRSLPSRLDLLEQYWCNLNADMAGGFFDNGCVEAAKNAPSSGWIWARELRRHDHRGYTLRRSQRIAAPFCYSGWSSTTVGDLVDRRHLRDALEWSHPGYLFWDEDRLRLLGFFELKWDALYEPPLTGQGCRCRSVEERFAAPPMGEALPAESLKKALE